MPEPFKPEDVIGKMQDEGGDELLVVKVLDEARIYAQDSSGWYSRGFYVDDVAELFRQLAAKDKQIAAKSKVITELTRDKAEAHCRIVSLEGWERAKDAEIAKLGSMMKLAGLQAFLKDETPDRIAEHLAKVAASHINYEHELNQEIAKLKALLRRAESMVSTIPCGDMSDRIQVRREIMEATK